MRKARKRLVEGNASRQFMPRITCGSSAMSDSPFLTQKSVKITVPVRPQIRPGHLQDWKLRFGSRAWLTQRAGYYSQGGGGGNASALTRHHPQLAGLPMGPKPESGTCR